MNVRDEDRLPLLVIAANLASALVVGVLTLYDRRTET